MARKQKPIIKGSDPEYTSELQPLPTNKPTSEAPQPVEVEAKVQPIEPSVPSPAKPNIKKTPKEKPKQANVDDGTKREIALSAAVKLDQKAKLSQLEEKGVSSQVAVTLAGRRAIDQFELKPTFIEKAVADRLPMRDGYRSTKRLNATMLDQLRNEHDPYRLTSDGAMVRGQFEALFWSCLDDVIEELNSKH